LINKIKEWLARAAVAIYTFFTERVSPFFEKIGAAFKRMVIIDGDVYFTKENPKKSGKTPRVFSLYFGLVGTVLIGAFLAVAVFLGTKAAAEYYITTFYMAEEKREEREAEYASNLQDFVLEHNITASDADKLQEWIDDNNFVFISVYDGEELLFSSLREPTKDPEGTETPENPENPEDPDSSGGDQVGGILTGPTKEELLEQVAKITDTKQIVTNGEQVLLVKIYEFTEYLYRDIFTIISFILAMVILVAIIVEHFSRIIARIKRLQFDVNAVAEGRMDHEIVATGYDEITKLSYDIDNMRSAMLRNVEKEREALQMNTELITSMSHDIRTPLTVLMGYVDIMKSGLPPEEMEEYILASEKTVQRLKSLSDDMFKYFRAFGRGGEDITMEEYDAPTLFEQLLSEHVLLLSESGYRVNYNIDELLSERLIVRTDAPHLMRIVDNIFSNLYKYASIDEEVSIIGRRVDDLAVFEFKNTATRNAGAESSKVGLKTCKRLSEYILNSFEYGEEDGIFTLTFSLKLYEEGTNISESFVIR
jgi:signal transduction histidine kinase